MNLCGCKFGGAQCAACRGAANQARRISALETMVATLAKRVVVLEETVIAQVAVNERLQSILDERPVPPSSQPQTKKDG